MYFLVYFSSYVRLHFFLSFWRKFRSIINFRRVPTVRHNLSMSFIIVIFVYMCCSTIFASVAMHTHTLIRTHRHLYIFRIELDINAGKLKVVCFFSFLCLPFRRSKIEIMIKCSTKLKRFESNVSMEIRWRRRRIRNWKVCTQWCILNWSYTALIRHSPNNEIPKIMYLSEEREPAYGIRVLYVDTAS